MMDTEQNYSIDDEGYFGITHLNMGAYGAHLIINRVTESQKHGIKLYYDQAHAHHHEDRHAVTIEGYAISVSTPDLAIQSLEESVMIAREMDELNNPLAG